MPQKNKYGDFLPASHEDALRAGYRYRGRVPCPVCGMVVGIYQKLDQFPLFLDTETMRPHVTFAHNEMPAAARDFPVDGKSAAAGDR